MPTLDWIGKKAVVNHHREVPFHVLKEDAALSFGEKDNGNLIVEGDNLVALKALLPYYAGKVKCIYIDPPYNTGNEKWIYNDNVNSPEIKKWLGKVVGKEAEDLSRHDKWLCMMYPRLQLLREFLTEDGAIFISIDDNEYPYLTLMCNEIFGYSNSIGPIIQNKLNSKNDTINVQKNHEFIAIYRKKFSTYPNSTKVKETLLNTVKRSKEIFKEGERFYYLNDAITTRGEGGVLEARPNLGYTVYYHPQSSEKLGIHDYNENLISLNSLDDVYSNREDLIEKGYIPIRPPRVRGKLGCWTWALEKFNNESDNIVITGRDGSFSVKKRTFVDASLVYEFDGKLLFDAIDKGNSKSIIEFFTNDGTNVLNEIIDIPNVFDNPKNVSMLKYLINLISNKDSLILDSFAGSGTTAQAVLELNKEDGGNRKFILTEMLPEVAQPITRERVKRVIERDGLQESVGFKFAKLGEPMHAAEGDINPNIKYPDLARHVFFMATGTPLAYTKTKFDSPLIGIHGGVAIYLLYNGILGDTSVNGGNRLTQKVFASLFKHNGAKIIYGTACALGETFLRRNNITFKQIPYSISTS